MTIEIPDRMKKFPLWKGKYPIHYTVFVEDGIPQFKTLARARQVEAIQKNLCHLCGERMSAPYWFIGGPECHKHHNFLDGPMHEECARYACQACPFLNNPEARYGMVLEPKNERHIVHNMEQAGQLRPATMVLAATNTYVGKWKGKQYPEFTAGEWVITDLGAMPQRYEGNASELTKKVIGPLVDQLIEEGKLPPENYKIKTIPPITGELLSVYQGPERPLEELCKILGIPARIFKGE